MSTCIGNVQNAVQASVTGPGLVWLPLSGSHIMHLGVYLMDSGVFQSVLVQPKSEAEQMGVNKGKMMEINPQECEGGCIFNNR